jgi:hypothetical protein
MYYILMSTRCDTFLYARYGVHLEEGQDHKTGGQDNPHRDSMEYYILVRRAQSN